MTKISKDDLIMLNRLNITFSDACENKEEATEVHLYESLTILIRW